MKVGTLGAAAEAILFFFCYALCQLKSPFSCAQKEQRYGSGRPVATDMLRFSQEVASQRRRWENSLSHGHIPQPLGAAFERSEGACPNWCKVYVTYFSTLLRGCCSLGD